MNLPAFIRENEALGPMTTFRIGGRARWFACPAGREELEQVFALSRELGVRVVVLGGGSNLLVADSGIDAMVVKLSDKGEFGGMNPVPECPLTWRVGAAAPLRALVDAAARRGVAGLEALAGIPGTVGGAAAMNAGGPGEGIGTFVSEAEVYRLDGRRESLDRSRLDFAYRRGGLSGRVGVGFTLDFPRGDDAEVLLGRMREFMERKRTRQPLAAPSAGCVFKNPPGASAGALLDSAGCKGMSEGRAEVSSLHANFIINRGGATCRDAASLMLRMSMAVRKASGVVLRPEVVFWGNEPLFRELAEEAADA